MTIRACDPLRHRRGQERKYHRDQARSGDRRRGDQDGGPRRPTPCGRLERLAEDHSRSKRELVPGLEPSGPFSAARGASAGRAPRRRAGNTTGVLRPGHRPIRARGRGRSGVQRPSALGHRAHNAHSPRARGAPAPPTTGLAGGAVVPCRHDGVPQCRPGSRRRLGGRIQLMSARCRLLAPRSS